MKPGSISSAAFLSSLPPGIRGESTGMKIKILLQILKTANWIAGSCISEINASNKILRKASIDAVGPRVSEIDTERKKSSHTSGIIIAGMLTIAVAMGAAALAARKPAEAPKQAECINCNDVRDWKVSGDNLNIYTADGSEWVFDR